MLRRRQRRDPMAAVDPGQAPPRLAPVVAGALAVRSQWTSAVASLRPGPLRDRVEHLGGQVDDGVLTIWDAVQRIGDLENVAAAIDADAATDAFKRAKRDPSSPPELVDALEAQHRSANRLLNAREDAEARLRVLDATLRAAVSRALELALTGPAGGDDDGGLAGVLDELHALQRSLHDLGPG